jgi:hypothetical protein
MRVFWLISALLAACKFDVPPPQTNDAGEPISVAFEAATTPADERSGALAVGVVLSDAAATTVSVKFAARPDSAISPNDFTLTEGTLTFAPGETRKEITPMIIGDSDESESDEAFDVVLSEPSGVVLGELATHHITISNLILPRVTFAQPTTSTAEGTPSQIGLVLDKAADGDATVKVTITGGAATAVDDYTIAETVVTIPDGMTTVSVPIGEIDDALDENDEDITFVLAEPSGNLLIGETGTLAHTIVDNDPVPTIGFTEASRTVNENVGTVTLDVTLSAPSGRTVSIDFARAGNDSAADNDATVTGSPGTLTFAPGETAKSITVTINNDSSDENDEQVVVSLSNPVNCSPTQATHTTTITDDDDPPTVQFQNQSSIDNENDFLSFEAVSVRLSAASSKSIQVSFSRGGTLNFPQEYTLTGSPITFDPGETEQLIVIDYGNDFSNENDETVILTLTNATNATIGNTSVHTFTLRDDD